jgi:molybdenum-dependent DNA-binding transcriptional regulator ModE
MRIDFLGLQAFLGVAQRGSFHRAAAHLNLSQTALSHRLKQLEESLGVKLLLRTTRQVSLTPAGAELLPKARRLMEELSVSFADLRDRGRLAQERVALQNLAGLHCSGEGETGRAQRRHDQYRLEPEPVGGVVQIVGGRRFCSRAVPRDSRGGDRDDPRRRRSDDRRLCCNEIVDRRRSAARARQLGPVAVRRSAADADVFLENGVFIETGPHKHAIQQTFFLYVHEPAGNRIEVANAGARLILAPDWRTVTWTEQERKKGQAWGLKTIESFHTHGTPPVLKGD